MEPPEWEKAKENVCPVRQGRDVNALSTALKATKSDLEQAREVHEAAIQEAKEGRGEHASDPLAPCVAYVKWAVENYPAGSKVLTAAVEMPCRRFGKQSRFRDDPRLTRLWVRYADMRNDKLDVYTYMFQHGIGETSALFYEAWAASLELSRDFEKVEKVYQWGREKRAHPAERLKQREREFYKRMSARNRRAEKKKQEKEIKEMVDTQRAENRAARSEGLAQSTDIDSILALSNSAQEATGKRRPVRPALGSITERQARTGRRPVAPAASGHFAMSKPGQKPGENKMDEPVKIFVDTGKSSAERDHGPDDAGPLKRMIPRKEEVSKEDDGIPSKWSGETMPQNSALKRRRAAYSSSTRPIEIYQGPDESEEAEEAPRHAQAERKETIPIKEDREMPTNRRPFEILDERKDVDQASARDAKAARPIQKGESKPFTIHQDENKEVADGHPISDRLTGHDGNMLRSSENMVTDGIPSPTINTKLAMQEVDDMLNYTMVVEPKCNRSLQKMTEQVKQAPSGFPKGPEASRNIEILRDTNCDQKENMEGRQANAALVMTPEMEKRVLKPLPVREGVLRQIPESDRVCEDDGFKVVQRHVDDDCKSSMSIKTTSDNQEGPQEDRGYDKKLVDFFVQWTKNEPSFQLLKSEDPGDVGQMFDLELDNGSVVTLNPYYICTGEAEKSLVVFVEDLNNVYEIPKTGTNDDDDSDDEDQPCLPMKVSTTDNIWEFYIYRELERRLGFKWLPSIPRALSYFEGRTQSYLALDTLSIASLSDVLTSCGETGVSENLSMLFTADLLKCVESIHGVGIIHNDVTLNNVLLRHDGSELSNKVRYNAGGEGGWQGCGILLVDFNQSVDTQHWRVGGSDAGALAKHMQGLHKDRHADYKPDETTGLGYNIDAFGIAVCAAAMLKMSLADVRTSARGLKHAFVWTSVFERLIGLSGVSSREESLACLRACRQELETVLCKESSLHRDFTRFFRAQVAAQRKRQEASGLWK